MSLDECRVCGQRVKDFERDGYEDEHTGQRGHYVCDGDAPSEWVVIYGMGGWVCGRCPEPVESEPCRIHQPAAYARCVGADRENASERCPQPCEHLSQHDAREGRTCSEHLCTCTDRENGSER